MDPPPREGSIVLCYIAGALVIYQITIFDLKLVLSPSEICKLQEIQHNGFVWRGQHSSITKLGGNIIA